MRLWLDHLWPRLRLLYLFLGALFFYCLLSPPYLLIFGPLRRGTYWWALKFIRAMRMICGARIVTTISDEVDLAKPYVYVSNHLSYLDIAAVMTTVPIWWRFVAMKKLRYVPVFGGVMKDLGNIFIDRSTTEKAYRSIEEAARRIAGGQSILVYPEGGISRDGRIQPFKRGAFALAIRAGVPVVPIIMRGTDKVLDIHRAFSRSGTAYCDLLPPVPTEGLAPEDGQALAERVWRMMIESGDRLDGARRADRAA